LTNVTNTQARTISTLQEDKRALQTLNNELSRRVEAFREENIKLNAQVVDLMSKLNK
jgi:predicted phage gp36 major capsid-like protein